MRTICLKYRLYPSKSQQTKINSMLETCRDVYNSFVLWRKVSWETEQKSIDRYTQQREIAVWKHKTDEEGNLLFPELKEVYAHTLQDVAHRIDLAYRAFFRRIKAGDTPGYPRFKGEGQYNSLTYTETHGFGIKENAIRFARLGLVKAVIHREPIGALKQCKLVKQGLDWYACVFTEAEDENLPENCEPIAMDMGIEKFAVLSNGEQIENPKFFKQQEERLAKAQQKLEREKKDRKRTKKNRKTISRIHKKVRNQRHNFIHQQTRKLVNRYGVFFLEELRVSNMSRRPKLKQNQTTGEYLPNGASAKSGLNKSISDVAWNMFQRVLTEKAERAGRRVVAINPAYTSQDCYQCGYRTKKKLSERWHNCPMCGASLDRDLNAALNILALGLQRIGENP